MSAWCYHFTLPLRAGHGIWGDLGQRLEEYPLSSPSTFSLSLFTHIRHKIWIIICSSGRTGICRTADFHVAKAMLLCVQMESKSYSSKTVHLSYKLRLMRDFQGVYTEPARTLLFWEEQNGNIQLADFGFSADTTNLERRQIWLKSFLCLIFSLVRLLPYNYIFTYCLVFLITLRTTTTSKNKCLRA